MSVNDGGCGQQAETTALDLHHDFMSPAKRVIHSRDRSVGEACWVSPTRQAVSNFARNGSPRATADRRPSLLHWRRVLRVQRDALHRCVG